MKRFGLSFLAILLVVVLSWTTGASAEEGNRSLQEDGGVFGENTNPSSEPKHVEIIEPVIVAQNSSAAVNEISNQDVSIQSSQSLPFDFEFSLKRTLSSRTFDNQSSSVTIRIDDSCWLDTAGYSLSDQHFAIYLYTGSGTLIGYTLDMPILCDGNNVAHSVTFTSVPIGDIYFVITKPTTTYSYELEGYGRIYN